ncbi:MAG: TrpB-like pyridoxal phosphate-dependent enzyme [Candidatus Heimdallarchaeota archaeon]
MFDGIKVVLELDELPKQWYNIVPDLPKALDPPLNPMTKQPVSPEDLMPLFPMALLQQEMSPERWIDIPEEIQKAYRYMGRPTPLYRARRLEQVLKTPAKIYYKREDLSPPGSHKPNTAIAQAYFNMKEGVERLTTETGAGQWGTALSYACALFGLRVTVYMVRCSYDQKPYRKVFMQAYGAEVLSSPTTRTQAGRKILEEMPDHPGSLGLAISEAAEDAATHEDTKYSLGSVLNHVMLHQTIIGLEAKKQFAALDTYPDELYGCVGGGSNFAGFCYPFIYDKLKSKNGVRIVGVEPTAVPTMTRGKYCYDFGDTAETAPLLKMYTLGHRFVPPPIHAGGLRYHGDSPTLCNLIYNGVVEAEAYPQTKAYKAASLFAKTEGILPAPETAHAICAVIEAAKHCKKTGVERVLAFNYSGHGLLDMAGYQQFFNNELKDYAMPQSEIEKYLSDVPII